MSDSLQERRRRSFDAVAKRYLAHRPPYPAAALDLLSARVPPPADVLEVGPGPGLATLPMAERGYRIVGIELGARLAEEARRNVAGHDSVRIVTADFEAWEPPAPHAFDMVLAASVALDRPGRRLRARLARPAGRRLAGADGESPAPRAPRHALASLLGRD